MSSDQKSETRTMVLLQKKRKPKHFYSISSNPVRFSARKSCAFFKDVLSGTGRISFRFLLSEEAAIASDPLASGNWSPCRVGTSTSVQCLALERKIGARAAMILLAVLNVEN